MLKRIFSNNISKPKVMRFMVKKRLNLKQKGKNVLTLMVVMEKKKYLNVNNIVINVTLLKRN